MAENETHDVKLAILETKVKEYKSTLDKVAEISNTHLLNVRDLTNKMEELYNRNGSYEQNYVELMQLVRSLQTLTNIMERDIDNNKSLLDNLVAKVDVLHTLPIEELKTLPKKVDSNTNVAKIAGVISTLIISGLLTLLFGVLKDRIP